MDVGFDVEVQVKLETLAMAFQRSRAVVLRRVMQ